MACLVLMGSMTLLAMNINVLIEDLESENEVVAFVDESLTDQQAMDLQNTLANFNNVASVQFVSRDEAMQSFMSKYDDYLMEGIDSEVFRHRYVIHLEDISLMSQSQAELLTIPGIAKVNAHIDYANTFVNVRNIVAIISVILIVLMVFVCFFIMSNTIKLATVSRRDEIAIMKMVGATNGFIRLPFVVEGLVLGALGGLLAVGAEALIYYLVEVSVINAIAGQLVNVIPFGSLFIYVLIAYVGIGVLVGVFSGMNAIRNYLKV